jgi:hypothetical protein
VTAVLLATAVAVTEPVAGTPPSLEGNGAPSEDVGPDEPASQF